MTHKIEPIKTYTEEQIRKLTIEELQTKFLELQEIAKDGNVIIQKFQYERDLDNKQILNLNQRIASLAKRNIDKNEIIKLMAEEIFIRRAYSITCEGDIERLKKQIIREFEYKVNKKRGETI